MGDGRTREFTQALEAPAVLSVVLEAWWKIASTPGDLVDVLTAIAGASLLAGTFGGRRTPKHNAAHQFGGPDGLMPAPPKIPPDPDAVEADSSGA